MGEQDMVDTTLLIYQQDQTTVRWSSQRDLSASGCRCVWHKKKRRPKPPLP